MADLFTLSSSGLPDDVTLLHFRMVETIGQPYEIWVYFQARSPDDVDLADAIGAKAEIAFDRGDGITKQTWSGVFAAIENIHQADGLGVFRGLVVPPVFLLADSEHSRVFTNLSVKDFVSQVLDDAGLDSSDYEFRLNGSPEPEEHVCQYKESDLAFVHRWLEREGLYYYFEHTDDGVKMIIVDTNPTASLRTAAVPYYPTAGYDVTSKEAFQQFRAKRRATLSSIKLRDYNYMNPSLDVKGKASASSSGRAELSRSGDRFFTPDDGDRLAKLRADAALVREERYEAVGTAMMLRTGYLFEVENHPHGAYNKKYLATRIEHTASNTGALSGSIAELIGEEASDIYRVELEATDSALPYRPERITPWPRIWGQEIAVVDGPADSDYAQLDDAGRYLVTFHFDENTHDAGKASTLVRMMQPHAGNPEGFHFPLRKGTEVVIVFLGGDPDRPLIAGAVPNALNPSPITSKNHTHNIIITGGKNLIEIEDQEGKQWIDIYTPTEHTDIHMGAPKDFKDVGTTAATVQANLGEHTDGVAVRTIGGNQHINIGAKLEEHVVGNVKEDYDAQVDETYKGPKNEKVNNKVTETYGSGQETNVTGLRKIEITGPRTDHVTAPVTENYDATYTQTVGGAATCHWSAGATHDGPALTETFDAISQTGTGVILQKTANWTVKAGMVTWDHGPIMWTSPTATLNIPSWNNVGASWWTNGESLGSMYTMTIAINKALALSVQGIYVQINPVAITITPVLNVGLKGLYLENKGLELIATAIALKNAALHLLK